MKNFTFSLKWHEILKPYPEEIRREVYDAVIEYAASGEIINMQPLSRMAFDFIRYEIDEKAQKRENRLAKKQSKGTHQISDPDIITAEYISTGNAPRPVSFRNGGVETAITEKRITQLIRQCVQEMLDKGHTPSNNPNFMSSLGCLISNRFEVIRQEIVSRKPDKQFTDELWDAIFHDACKQFRA